MTPAVNGQEGQVPLDADILIPMLRSDLNKIKAVKFSEPELAKITRLQEWLAITRNPATGEPFIRQNSFSALVQFALNLTFRAMAQVAEQMARAEEGP